MTDSRYTTPAYLVGPCRFCGSTRSVRTYSRDGSGIECVYAGPCNLRQAAEQEQFATGTQPTTTTTEEPTTMATQPTTCQLATPSRTGADGRPYTTCGVRANPAGYCSECGTRVATRTAGPEGAWNVWVAACGAPLVEELELDGGATQRQVTATCDRPVAHLGEHLAAVLGHTGERTGELVEWPQEPEAAADALLASGATLQYVEGEEPQESVREYNRRMREAQQATRWAVEALEGPALDGSWPWLRVGAAMGPLSLGEADLLAVEWRARGWVARVVELTPEQLAEHEAREARPRDVSGEPREEAPAEQEGEALARLEAEQERWASGAYEAYQRQEDEAEAQALSEQLYGMPGLVVPVGGWQPREEPQHPLLAAASALGLGDCAPGCTCRGNATTTPSMLADASVEA